MTNAKHAIEFVTILMNSINTDNRFSNSQKNTFISELAELFCRVEEVSGIPRNSKKTLKPEQILNDEAEKEFKEIGRWFNSRVCRSKTWLGQAYQ